MSLRAPISVPRARPVAAPRSSPTPAPARRLRLVRAEELTPKARRRRIRLAALGTVTIGALGLFAVAAYHVVLTQNQFRLDRLQDQAATAQARYERLRLNVAQLESPERVVAAAQDRLGMVQPPKITYLAPQQPASTPPGPAGVRPRAQQHAQAAVAPGGPTSWSTVKPELAEHP